MQFIAAISRTSASSAGSQAHVPVEGNERILNLLARRVLRLQETLQSERLHSLLAEDHFGADNVLEISPNWRVSLSKSSFDVSKSNTSLLLESKDGARIHFASLSKSDLQIMKSSQEKIYCEWCAGELVKATGDDAPACPVCHKANDKTQFGDIDLRGVFKLADGSRWQKITPSEALCVAGAGETQEGQSSPIHKDQEVHFA